MSDKTKDYYSIAEAAAQIGKNPRTVFRWIKAGKLEATWVPTEKRGHWRIDREYFDQFVAERTKTYDQMRKEWTTMRREFLRLLNRVENGTVDEGDIRRARNAVGNAEDAD